MARGKKKENLTLEEKLEMALVPAEEQPYKVPENWCWVKLGEIIELVSGRDAKNTVCNDCGVGIPYILGASNLENNCFTVERWIEKPQVISLKGDILLSVKGTIGKIYLQKEEKINLSRQIMALRVNANMDSKILYWYLNIVCEELKEAGNGLIPGISRDIILGSKFSLPPLPEQQRIVEQIESLFSKLDETKEKLQEVLEKFDLRKKAILTKAFRGEYTNNWRLVHGLSLASWKKSRINEICISRAGYAFNSKKFVTSGYQVIRMGNLYGGKLDLSRTPVYIKEEDIDETILKRSSVHDGDILITLTGTKYKRDYGYAVCIKGNPELLVNQRILCLTPQEMINKDFLLFYLRSERFRDIFFSKETGGVNQGNVSSKFVENIEVPVPSLDEQEEIAKILNNVLEKEERAREQVEDLFEEIELMKKSILAKAFRGQLGTNNPQEESSIEILKSILDTQD